MLALASNMGIPSQYSDDVSTIVGIDTALAAHFASRILTEPRLTRQLVSFQASKNQPVYRWYKFKEAFSADLVGFLLDTYDITGGVILDPFAGSGTTLFAAQSRGMNAHGIELLPIGQEIIATRGALTANFGQAELSRLAAWVEERPWETGKGTKDIAELRITRGAYPVETKEQIGRYLALVDAETETARRVLRFALLCVLEAVSYTRKDGQYLRWDERAGRRQSAKPFHKGAIPSFTEAIVAKLEEIIRDSAPDHDQLNLGGRTRPGRIDVYPGSCLDVLPQLHDNVYSAVITSPPYCNRYDYTRTYALELAVLGATETGIARLRQQMLSCTVENRAKDLLLMNPLWAKPISLVNNHMLLRPILEFLEKKKAVEGLNNNGIPRMIRGYFQEMACVIAECGRTLRDGGYLFMVNDNVRYAGVSVSVDLILSHIAENLGFDVEAILVLPQGKGNSSQQMGEHGRESLRKCVYVWRKNVGQH